jgi:hypothetical protein
MYKLCYLSVLLLPSLAMPLVSFAHCDDVKHSGNHPHCRGEDPPPPPPELNSCPGDFPAFAYAFETTKKGRGHTSRSDVMVSNADASCEILVHSVSTTDYYSDLDFSYDSSSGLYRIAYNYESDESDTRNTGARPNIRVLQFTVSPDQSGTKIDQSLPLQLHKIFLYSGRSTAGESISANVILGNKLVFALTECWEDGTWRGDPVLGGCDNTIRTIEDVSGCIAANLGSEPDESCAELAFENIGQKANYPRWGLDTNRIYFRYSTTNGDIDLGVLDRPAPGIAWSAPGVVRSYPHNQDRDQNGSSAVWDFGLGPQEVLLNYVKPELQILEISDACTAAVSGAISCETQELATVVDLGDDFPLLSSRGKWTHHISISPDEGPNIMHGNDGSIYEFDPDLLRETELLNNFSGYYFDPVD